MYTRVSYIFVSSSTSPGFTFKPRSACIGTYARARIQLNHKDTARTINKSRTYSPVVSGDKNIGKKVRIPIVVAPSKGQAVFFVIFTKAAGLGIPFFRSTRIPSVITIALSTSIPIATINEASETRGNVPCIMYSKSNEPNTTITRPAPMIYPLRNPMKSMTTKITITTDSIRFTMKTLIALFTRAG